MFREALDIGRRLLGDEHPRVASWKVNLGGREEGRYRGTVGERALSQESGHAHDVVQNAFSAHDVEDCARGTHGQRICAKRALIGIFRQSGKHISFANSMQ